MKKILDTIKIIVVITLTTLAVTKLNNFIEWMPKSDFWFWVLGIFVIVFVIFANYEEKIIKRFFQ